jgi:hypothetical protein
MLYFVVLGLLGRWPLAVAPNVFGGCVTARSSYVPVGLVLRSAFRRARPLENAESNPEVNDQLFS